MSDPSGFIFFELRSDLHQDAVDSIPSLPVTFKYNDSGTISKPQSHKTIGHESR